MTGAFDLLELAQHDTELKRAAAHRGGEYHGPCPFCGGRDRFRVQPARDFWACRQCGRSGDAIAYAVESGRLTPQEAGRLRHGETVTGSATATATARPEPAAELATPPGDVWQARAWAVAVEAQELLRSPAGDRARAWLAARGLAPETIDRAGLGYIAADRYEPRAIWGLPEEHDANGRIKQVWIPRGIVIPWFIGPDLWRLNIRRPAGSPKYCGPAGAGNGLYNADGLTPTRAALLTEGEFDALLIEQHAGDLVTACATGSTEGARRGRWLAMLTACPATLAAFDADPGGDNARAWWIANLKNAHYWRPFWGDASDMARAGADLRGWVLAGLREYTGAELAALRADHDALTAEIAAVTAVMQGGAG